MTAAVWVREPWSREESPPPCKGQLRTQQPTPNQDQVPPDQEKAKAAAKNVC